MFKKILVPTDGSRLSDFAIAKAITFAKSINAAVYGFHAAPDYTIPIHGVDVYSDAKFQGFADKEARNYLAGIEAKANEAGVPCTTGFTVSVYPHRAIYRCGERTKLRSDLHGFPWQAGIVGIVARK